MLTETVELTLGHVGLGNLGEVPLLALFASAQAHLLTAGTGHTLRDVTDASGAHLYPGYSWLHLRVPPTRLLERFRVWDRVAIGVEVKRFGGMILDSTYVLGAPDELPSTIAACDLDALPSMRASSLWVVSGKPAEPSSPKAGAIAELPAVATMPEALGRFRTMRASGSFGKEPRRWSTRTPISYPIRNGRDVARDHNLMFATYVEIMDVATATLLGEEVSPALPSTLLEHRTLLEREVFFLGHIGSGGRILVELRAELSPCAENLHGAATDMVSAGILDLVFELYEAGSNILLAVGRAKELFLVPRSRPELIGDLSRFTNLAVEEKPT